MCSRTDTEKITLAALRMEEIGNFTETIEKEGAFYAAGDLVKRHPAVSQRDAAIRHLQSLLSDFGLDPASRSKVWVAAEKPGEDPMAELARQIRRR